MRRLVSLYQESGQSQKVFCEAHGITEDKLNYWMQKLSETSKKKTPSLEATSDFIPITATAEVKSTHCITIRCRNGVEIEIPM